MAARAVAALVALVTLSTVPPGGAQLLRNSPSRKFEYADIYGGYGASSGNYGGYGAPPAASPSRYDRMYAAMSEGERLRRLGYDHGQDAASYANDLYAAAQKHSVYAQELYTAAQSTVDVAEKRQGYGSSYGSDCDGLGVLSMVLGLGALAAFAAYYYIQVQAAAGARSLPVMAPLLEALGGRYPEPALVEAVTSGACRGLDLLQAQPAAGARQMDSSCLDGIIGPAAGFFALAAIIAYALAQAAAAGGRSFGHAESVAMNAAARQLLMVLTTREECMTSSLCAVAQTATLASPAVRTPIKLASVAIAWYAARLRHAPYSKLCWSLVDGLRDQCSVPASTCSSVPN